MPEVNARFRASRGILAEFTCALWGDGSRGIFIAYNGDRVQDGMVFESGASAAVCFFTYLVRQHIPLTVVLRPNICPLVPNEITS